MPGMRECADAVCGQGSHGWKAIQVMSGAQLRSWAFLPCCIAFMPSPQPFQCVAVGSMGLATATVVVPGSGASGPDGSWIRGSFRSISARIGRMNENR